MKILFLPNWSVKHLDHDDASLQAPDKAIRGESYWFFRYFKKKPNVEVIGLNKRSVLHKVERLIGVYFLQSIQAFRQRKLFDVVISHGAQSGLFFALLQRLVPVKSRVKHIIFDIGGMNGARKNKIECSIIRFALGSNPFIICHSSSLLSHYKGIFPSISDRARFIHFGVDSEYFTPQVRTSAKRQILAFGNSKRDYFTLLEAWKKCDSDVELKIIGYTQEIQQSRVIFVPSVSLAQLMDEIASSMFIVIPLPVFNYSYGQMSFLQSMSMGKVVIVTKTPGSSDYLLDGEGAFYVPPYDPNLLGERIFGLLNNEEELKKQSSAARTFIESHRTERQMAEKIEEFINEISGS